MIDLRRYPKTIKVLQEHAIFLVAGKPQLMEIWQEARVPHLRGVKRECCFWAGSY
jgi:hypothetical protein